tara:strand:- start:1184 stop:1333 length:150 start_codon:yes stop_codon:yes gene_type:complete
MDVIKELLEYLIQNKKYLLIPLILILVLFGALIVLTQGSAVSPFIYSIF